MVGSWELQTCSNLGRNIGILGTPFAAGIPTSGSSLVGLSLLTCEEFPNSGLLVQNYIELLYTQLLSKNWSEKISQGSLLLLTDSVANYFFLSVMISLSMACGEKSLSSLREPAGILS